MTRFTSRKFLTALSGIITGIILICMGDVTEGATTLASAVIIYCAAEGYVDAKRIKSDMENAEKSTGNI